MPFDLQTLAQFAYYFFGILVITNPLSTAIIFITLTEDASDKERRETAIGAAATATIILTIFTLGGMYIFNFFGISIGAFQITGGIVLISVGLRLLKGESKVLHHSHFEADEVMVVPLAIPMLAGAGAITTVIVYTSNEPSMFETALIIIAIALNGILAYVILDNSNFVKRVFKERGLRVLNRLMGLIVLSMAVEFVISGLTRAGII